MNEILMPALSPTMEEGKIAKWLVKEGESVKPGDLIAEIETDKATMEIEAVAAGIIDRILVTAGAENVKVKTPIALIRANGLAPASLVTPSISAESKATTTALESAGATKLLGPAAKQLAVEAGLDVSMIVKSGRAQRITKGDVISAHGERGAAQALDIDATRAIELGALDMTPLARQMALQAKIDLSTLKCIGARITKRLIEGMLGRGKREISPAFLNSEPTALRSPVVQEYEETEKIPLDGMRKTIARRMTQAFWDVPHFPMSIDVTIDALLAVRARLNSEFAADDVKLSVTDFLVRASALALLRAPDCNVSFAGDHIVKYKHAHVAVAVAVPDGLITPVIQKAETKGLAEISRELKVLIDKARARKLLPAEYEGGTFTISNLGMYGIKTFSSILNEPQAMILSVGAGEKRVQMTEGVASSVSVMNLTLTCDHRALDGATAAQFLAILRRFIEQPATMLL